MTSSSDATYNFAYYCSGHGFGHATRTSALASILVQKGHKVHIVTNAPSHPFTQALSSGAHYRHALIDAGIVQPRAYDVDREATIKGLREFMSKRDEKVEEEAKWLNDEKVDAVLVDAPFLPCAAAERASIPSVIISNFTFCSCYSYLDTEPTDSTLSSLVRATIADYSNASLLLRLPGAIPIPGFDLDAPLPSVGWVDLQKGKFTDEIYRILERDPNEVPCNPTSSSPSSTRTFKRRVIDTPLIVRPLSPSVYTPKFRTEMLESIGIPESLFGHKILLVSFGGQSIPKPKSPLALPTELPLPSPVEPLPSPLELDSYNHPTSSSGQTPNSTLTAPTSTIVEPPSSLNLNKSPTVPMQTTSSTLPIPPSDSRSALSLSTKRRPDLLPPGWIAVVCGLSGTENEIKRDLPPGFFACSRDVYVPDLTAVVDVVLGKLGYGTCSETLATKTPFLYVPRPLFVEEYGLKRLMQSQGVSVEISRADFEAGLWEDKVLEAWNAGKELKEEERRKGWRDEGKMAGLEIAGKLQEFMKEWREWQIKN